MQHECSQINSEKIVDYIENEIIHGRLRKGDKLPTERKMAEDLGVSRASVREAIKALMAMGIVKSIQGSGNYITDDPDSTVNRPLCALFALNDGTLDNLLQLRALLEAEACKDIVRSATDEEIAALERLMRYDYNGSYKEQACNDSRFHMALVQHSHNTLIPYLYTTIQRLIDACRERVLEATEQRHESHLTYLGHENLIRALYDRDLNRATEAVQEHLLLSEDYREALDLPFRRLL